MQQTVHRHPTVRGRLKRVEEKKTCLTLKLNQGLSSLFKIGDRVNRLSLFMAGPSVMNKDNRLTQLSQQDYRLIGIDLRGYGQSDKPWMDYTFDLFADDIKQVLDNLDLQDVTLVGFSMGGAITIRYMARHAGARVTKVALLGAAAPCLAKKPDFPQGLDSEPYNNLIKACHTDRAQMNADFGNFTFYKPLSPALANWFTSLGMQASPHATARCVIALRDSDLRPDLATIIVPTTILHGIHDNVAPIDITAEVMHQGIKGSTLIRFEESGHGLFYDEKERLNQELISLLAN